MKGSPTFVYKGTMKFDPDLSPLDAKEYEKLKYKKAISKQIKELRKEALRGRKEKESSEQYFNYLFETKLNHRTIKFKYENGEVYPKNILIPNIRFIQYAEPHVLITDSYDEPKEWYRLREIIEDFSEEAYLSYETGFWFSSITAAINCCEYVLKYELFRHFKKTNKELLEKASQDYYLTLGKIKDNAYNCLDELNIRQLFYDKIDYLNLVRSSIYHFNPEKAKKASEKGILEVEKIASISDDMLKPIIAFRIYSIMLDLINHFYNEKKAFEYAEECVADWMEKRSLSEVDLKNN